VSVDLAHIDRCLRNVALGKRPAAMFSHDDALAEALFSHGARDGARRCGGSPGDE